MSTKIIKVPYNTVLFMLIAEKSFETFSFGIVLGTFALNLLISTPFTNK